jgi:hypothetical protein
MNCGLFISVLVNRSTWSKPRDEDVRLALLEDDPEISVAEPLLVRPYKWLYVTGSGSGITVHLRPQSWRHRPMFHKQGQSLRRVENLLHNIAIRN